MNYLIFQDKLDISLESDRKIELNGKAVPTYADNVTLLYKADESGCVSVDENGIVTPLKEGTGIVTVYSAKYPEIKKDVIIAVREKEEKVYVTEINVNQAPSTLYIGHTHHTFIPEIIPADANIDNELTVSADDNSIVKIEKIGSEYKVEPLREGSVIITFQTANGVTNEVSLNVGKVMNVKGYYAIDRVEYTLADKTEIFTPQKDNLQGEFAINLLEAFSGIMLVSKVNEPNDNSYLPSLPDGNTICSTVITFSGSGFTIIWLFFWSFYSWVMSHCICWCIIICTIFTPMEIIFFQVFNSIRFFLNPSIYLHCCNIHFFPFLI